MQLSNPYPFPVTAITGCNMATRMPIIERLLTDIYTTPQNLGEIEVNGFEAEAQFVVNNSLNLTFAYSTINGEH